MMGNIYDRIQDEICDHLNDQPYEIECAKCGEVLRVDKDVDNDGDMTISVTPCATCLAEVTNAAS